MQYEDAVFIYLKIRKEHYFFFNKILESIKNWQDYHSTFFWLGVEAKGNAFLIEFLAEFSWSSVRKGGDQVCWSVRYSAET